jgi:hypothetical protein
MYEDAYQIQDYRDLSKLCQYLKEFLIETQKFSIPSDVQTTELTVDSVDRSLTHVNMYSHPKSNGTLVNVSYISDTILEDIKNMGFDEFEIVDVSAYYYMDQDQFVRVIKFVSKIKITTDDYMVWKLIRS